MSKIYDSFKHWFEDSDGVWLISDPHFGDLESYKLRFPEAFTKHEILVNNKIYKIELDDYSNEKIVDWLDNFQIKCINSKVGKNSTIIILGDI